MAVVPVTVELPQYTHSFIVNVPQTSVVRDIKQEISNACPGNPRVEGQRLISRGRVLDDAEKVDSLWASEDARVVHLAVNPGSWSTNPPEVKGTASPPLSSTLPSSTLPTASSQTPQNGDNLARSRAFSAYDLLSSSPLLSRHYDPLPYILHMHHKALRALSHAAPPSPRLLGDTSIAKDYAMAMVSAAGYAWPAIFDEEFPPHSDGGVTYEYTMISGKPYLQNLTPHAAPTSRQQHALNVLAYTFPLFSVSSNHSPYGAFLNLRTQLANLNPAGPNGNVNGGAARPDADARVIGIAVRIPVRAILTPLILLCLRTLLLLYFFSPARKPIFGLLLGAWVLYEAWGAVRGAIVDNVHVNGNGDAQRPLGPRRRANNANGANGRHQPPRVPNAARATSAAASNADAILSRLAQLNLDDEQRALEGDGIPEPGLFHKARVFVSLIVLTLHPAFWNRRRAALKMREGRLRTEANAREAAVQETEGEQAGDERARQAREQLVAKHERRSLYVKEYVERVRKGDWTDD
ncbi:hypothetical protein DFH11DRAFT_1705364 [Phellopilus nigrolimitatus]|nr:hypothetical protein DFH11DRAFT_1705364 [Phellopilus nigrolimitatus]